MALLDCHMYSHTLFSNISFYVSLPTPSSGDTVNYATLKRDFGYDEGLPVAYLLHGMFGDASSWIRYSSIDRYAQDRRIAVVSCSAGNNFYQNIPGGLSWETFFTRELPAYICALFPVSPRREDTFIGGFSMGGYGAWHLALSAPERYSKAASLSGALDLQSLVEHQESVPAAGVFNWKALLGDTGSLAGSHADLFAQYKRCAEAGCVPALYQACGTEDCLYPMNCDVRDRFKAMGCNLTSTEGPGGHDWAFWDREIVHVLDWFLEDRKNASGAVLMG